MAWQLSDKVDCSWRFQRAEFVSAKFNQLCFIRVRVMRMLANRLDDSFHFFAKLIVWHTKHGDIGNLWVSEKNVLNLLRVDIDPAGNDHEILAVGQVKVAVGIDMSDITVSPPSLFASRADRL